MVEKNGIKNKTVANQKYAKLLRDKNYPVEKLEVSAGYLRESLL